MAAFAAPMTAKPTTARQNKRLSMFPAPMVDNRTIVGARRRKSKQKDAFAGTRCVTQMVADGECGADAAEWQPGAAAPHFPILSNPSRRHSRIQQIVPK